MLGVVSKLGDYLLLALGVHKFIRDICPLDPALRLPVSAPSLDSVPDIV
jgi:hypothetical protein